MTAPPGAMNLLCWNCRGLGTDSTVGELHKMVKLAHCRVRPSLLFLSETKMRDNKVRRFHGLWGLMGVLLLAVKEKVVA